jgi:hypothetical protein
MSATKPLELLWRIELLPNDAICDTSNQEKEHHSEDIRKTPRSFDTVRISVSLEAIKYEYYLRAAVKRARQKHPQQLCVCDSLEFATEHEQEFWAAESGHLI